MTENIATVINKLKNISEIEFQNLIEHKNIPNNFKYIANGGAGIVYEYFEYAVKINTHNRLVDNEIDILKKYIIPFNNAHKEKHIFTNIYDIMNIHGKTVILMELMDISLNTWCETSHSEYEWYNVLKQLFNCILIMHKSLHIVHNDLSYNNIMFSAIDKNTIKIIDFGQASKIYDTKINLMRDLNKISFMYKKFFVDKMYTNNNYSVETLSNMCKKFKDFDEYIISNKQFLSNKKRHTQLLLYFLIEHEYFNIVDLPNYPPQKIVDLLISLQTVTNYRQLEKIVSDINLILHHLNNN